MVDFSLGAAGVRNQPHQEAEEANEGIHTESLFLYGGGGSVRGFELWQHQQHQIHPQRHPHQLLCQASTATLLAFGASDEPVVMNPARTGSNGGGGGMNCQDCGNQAKKDCVHMRCRTCCKSRGLHCLTHVKSTWVPAATRRDRQQQLAAVLQQSPGRHRAAAGESTKRPRDPSARLPTIITASASVGTEGVLSFPAEVTSPALFRCVRVSPMEVAVDQFAYQTSVSIGGHVFKGILYDQGQESPPECRIHHGGETSSTATPSGNRRTGAGAASSAAVLLHADPASLYPTPLSAFIAGTQLFPPPREALTQLPTESRR